MTAQDLDLLDAIQLATEAERKAAALYADAAEKTANPLGQGLFDQLAGFEREHYDELVELEKSLRGQGAITRYEDRELAVEMRGEVGNIPNAEKMSAMGIITMAIEIERSAKKRYLALAGQATDPAVVAMFQQLAEEEQFHYVTLNDAYWSLNNHGVWVWNE